jgi:hypothetical protein
MPAVKVNVENFARAETDHMMQEFVTQAGGVNTWAHNRGPTPLDRQPVVRMNRDTLYSVAVVDISAGATVTLPDAGQRYISAMVVNQDHYVNAVLHHPGPHDLSIEQFDTPFVTVAVRVLVDPNDPSDVAEVVALQDQVVLSATSASPFELPEYDMESYTETRTALRTLGKNLAGYERAFGRREDVDPIRHLLGTAGGWGGLPESEAYYLNVSPGLPVGAYELTVPPDVPVDGFWSVSLYDADGYFPTRVGDVVSINNLTAARDHDGSVNVHFGGPEDLPNRLPTVTGWNYIVRFYRPRAEILDGTWKFPDPAAAS